ncbi:hypothetical protein J2S74_003505 [Evansella vedderi]|uniref:Uncharacterized protein n=1 Tax=Evansella vedderi TaxID=38282 RepID=A0ABT9ZZH0_9BACI|nr:hypothetical protein [Evansella vedderi]MDQ0256106.1 hypothetical protein [Evansella vedderi]
MLIYSFLFIFPLLLYFIGMTRKAKNRTKMEKMMLAMGGSMLVGFTIGIYFGGLLHGAFFSSLLISIIVTSVIGILIGLPHGNLATIEGLFTGGMAGLMGAMTAEMLSIPEVRILLLLLLLLMGLGAFWSLHFWKKGESVVRKSLTFLVHFSTMCYLLLVTFIFIWMPPFEDKRGIHGEHDHTLYDNMMNMLTLLNV